MLKQKPAKIDIYKPFQSPESIAGSANATVVHCGINDIKTKDPN